MIMSRHWRLTHDLINHQWRVEFTLEGYGTGIDRWRVYTIHKHRTPAFLAFRRAAQRWPKGFPNSPLN